MKKGRTELEDDEDEEDKEGVDESPEEVHARLSHPPFLACSLRSSAFSPLQRILSCKKVGSILRDARDRVVSLAADAGASVIACHVSAGVV